MYLCILSRLKIHSQAVEIPHRHTSKPDYIKEISHVFLVKYSFFVSMPENKIAPVH